MSLEARIKIEKQILEALVDEVLNKDYHLTVRNEIHSRDKAAIIANCKQSGQDTLQVFDSAGKHVGNIWLVYGNLGYDVIADYSWNNTIVQLLLPVKRLAAALEIQHTA